MVPMSTWLALMLPIETFAVGHRSTRTHPWQMPARAPVNVRPMPATTVALATRGASPLSLAAIGSATNICWTAGQVNYDAPPNASTLPQRCAIRYATLDLAKEACEGLRADWCGAIVRDHGLKCGEGRGPKKTTFELRTARAINGQAPASWTLHARAPHIVAGQEDCRTVPAVEANPTRAQLATTPRRPPCCSIENLDQPFRGPVPLAATSDDELAMQQRAIACKTAADAAGGTGYLTGCMHTLADNDALHVRE